MKTTIKTIIIVLAGIIAAACTKDRQDMPELSTIQIRASLGSKTRVADEAAYAEADGIKASWEQSDVLYVFSADGTCSEFTVSSIESDGTATFTGTASVAAGSKVSAMLKNKAVQGGSYDSSTKTVTVDLSSQEGTLEDAGKHDVLFATGTFNGGEDPLNLSFEHKNAIAKFILKLPDEDSSLKLSCLQLSSGPADAKTFRNRMAVKISDGSVENLSGGSADADGDIVITPADGSLSASAEGTVTVYLSIPAAAFQNSIIEGVNVVDASDHRLWRVAGSEALTPQAGFTYSIPRNVCEQVSTGSIWASDADTTVNGKSLSSNRTGSPLLTVATKTVWGRSYTCEILQVAEKDFGGRYALTGDARVVDMSPEVSIATENVSGTYGTKGGKTSGLYYDGNWEHPSSNSGASTAMTLTFSSANEDNLTVQGFYGDLTMPAKVTISRGEKKAVVELKIKNEATLMGSGTYQGEYFAFQTELIQNASGTIYELGFGNGGQFSYRGEAILGNSEVKLDFASRQVCTAYPDYLVLGILLNRYSADGNGNTSGDYLIRSTANPYCKSAPNKSGAAYAWVIQGDFSMSKAISTASSGGINATGYTQIN